MISGAFWRAWGLALLIYLLTFGPAMRLVVSVEYLRTPLMIAYSPICRLITYFPAPLKSSCQSYLFWWTGKRWSFGTSPWSYGWITQNGRAIHRPDEATASSS